MRTAPTAIAIALITAGATACGGDTAPKEPTHIAYEYRLGVDRDSISTDLDKGKYEVRVEGDCSAHQLRLTKGGTFDDKLDVDDLVAEGLEIVGSGKWRIQQSGGEEMPDCVGLSLYPEGVAAPPAPPPVTTPQASSTTAVAPLPGPIRIEYQFHLEDDRDSLSTPLAAGPYQVRIEGDCMAHTLEFTEGGFNAKRHKVTDLVRDGFDVKSSSKWRIQQPNGDEMSECAAVVLYPEGVEAPAPPIEAVVDAWARAHLEAIGTGDGVLLGYLDVVLGYFQQRGFDRAQPLCVSGVSAPRVTTQGSFDGIDAYPGMTDLKAAWATMISAARTFFESCARSPEGSVDELETYSASHKAFTASVGRAIAEVTGPNGESNLTDKFNEQRDYARAKTFSDQLGAELDKETLG